MLHPFQKKINFCSRKCLFFIISAIFLISCSTDDTDEPDPLSTAKEGLTIYKNQTGDPNADALQAHYKDEDLIISVYGNFDSFNDPDIPRTLTFQKKNNDTIVNFIFDPYTSRISSSFISVRGEKLPVVMKFSYPLVGSDLMAISLYDYDWASQTGDVFFRTLVNGETAVSQNTTSQLEPYSKQKKLGLRMGATSNEFLDAIVDAVVVVAAGKAIISGVAAVPAITTAAVATIGAAAAVGVAVGVVAIALTAIISDADASELIPTDGPYPSGIPVSNPVPSEVDPTPNLEESECGPGTIGFSAYMDQEGSIGIGNISGGNFPYTFYVNGSAQEKQFFINDYPDGTYMISVKDANGCIGSKMVSLTREKGSGNGINLNGMFYPLKYVYVDYNIGILKDEDYPYVRYGHAIFFSPEPINFDNQDYDYILSGMLISDQPDSLPAGEYESNIVGLALGKKTFFETLEFYEGQDEIYLGSLYTETAPNKIDWKKRAYIFLNWEDNQANFNFHLYNEREELVDGFVKAEVIEVDLNIPE